MHLQDNELHSLQDALGNRIIQLRAYRDAIREFNRDRAAAETVLRAAQKLQEKLRVEIDSRKGPSLMECPNCSELELPTEGGECGECGIPSFF